MRKSGGFAKQKRNTVTTSGLTTVILCNNLGHHLSQLKQVSKPTLNPFVFIFFSHACFFLVLVCSLWVFSISPLGDVPPRPNKSRLVLFFVVHTDTCLAKLTYVFAIYYILDAPQSYPFLPYHPIRVYKVVSTYAELQFNKLMRLVPLFGHFARFQLTNSKKTDMIK